MQCKGWVQAERYRSPFADYNHPGRTLTMQFMVFPETQKFIEKEWS